MRWLKHSKEMNTEDILLLLDLQVCMKEKYLEELVLEGRHAHLRQFLLLKAEYCNIYLEKCCFHWHMSIQTLIDIMNYNHHLIMYYHHHIHHKTFYHHHRFQYKCWLLMEKFFIGKVKTQLHIVDMLQNYHILNNNQYIFHILRVRDWRKIQNHKYLKYIELMIVCMMHLHMLNNRLMKSWCMFHMLNGKLNMLNHHQNNQNYKHIDLLNIVSLYCIVDNYHWSNKIQNDKHIVCHSIPSFVDKFDNFHLLNIIHLLYKHILI